MDNRRAVLGVELVLNTRVQQLIVEDGAVKGVVADGQTLRSRAVLLACGGISHADPEMIHTWFPDAYETLPPGYHPTGPAGPGHRGDGVHMARQAGADIIGKNCGLATSGPFLPNAPPIWHGYNPSSVVYVNVKGQRFAPETAPYAVMPGLVKAQGYNCWGVFDEAARLRSDPTGSGYAHGWDPQFVLDSVARGDILQADTIEELAVKCGIRPGGLRTTIDQFNEDMVTGHDRWFLRDMEALHPIAQGPFYAFRYGNSTFVVASVGPRIDSGAHALDEDGQIIPGLYAAGEAGAGVLGERYVGGGNGVANAITMGRVAGMTIGKDLMGKYARGPRAAFTGGAGLSCSMPGRSMQRAATVGGIGRPGHERGGIAQQEDDHAGDLLGLSWAAERIAADEGVALLVGCLVQHEVDHRRPRHAGAHGVDPNRRRQFHRQRPRQAQQARLGCGIVGAGPHRRLQAHARGDIDHRALA